MRNEAGSPVAVVTAIREEFEAVVRAARDVRFESAGRAQARIGSAEVVIGLTGDGPRNAERGAAALCEAVRPRALVGAGVAAGLSPLLVAGSLVASRRIFGESGEAPKPDQVLLAHAVAAGAAAATLVTVSRPVVAASAKAVLARSAVVGEPAAVDMESAGWSRAAAARGIPFLAVRAISDRFDEELPDYLRECVGEDGGIRRAAVVRHALFRPATIPALWRMRRRVEAAGVVLAEFLSVLLAAEI
jgi:adenosylhomocysteine nucleosidase